MPYAPTMFYNNNCTVVGDNVLYTVPTGKTAIITEWNFAPSNGPADGFLYAGNSSQGIVAYNRAPGASAPGTFPVGAYRYRGMYVVHSGEQMFWGGSQPANAWQSVWGLLGDGAIAGRTPMRLGTVAPTAAGGTELNCFVAGGNGAILKTILVSNYSGSQTQYSLRKSSTPIGPWYGYIEPQEVKQFDVNYFFEPGQNLLVNDFTGDRIRFTAYGWQL